MSREASGTGDPKQEEAELLGSILAHDLANHLQIIEGHADLLLDRLDESVAVGRLTSIKRQTIAANSLIQAVRTIEDSVPSAQLDAVEVRNVLEDEARNLRSAYPHANVSVDVPDGVAVRADELLASVFRNLLQNAVRHNDSSTPHVAVTARMHDSTTTVVVEDDGPGLPDEAKRKLLGQERGRPGSGIDVVRTLVDRYGAEISVEREEDGTAIAITFRDGGE